MPSEWACTPASDHSSTLQAPSGLTQPHSPFADCLETAYQWWGWPPHTVACILHKHRSQALTQCITAEEQGCCLLLAHQSMIAREGRFAFPSWCCAGYRGINLPTHPSMVSTSIFLFFLPPLPEPMWSGKGRKKLLRTR